MTIRAIALSGNVRIRSLPTIGVWPYVFHRLVRGTRWVPFLDYVDYNKERCIATLVEKVGFRPYPYKHYESIFTRFYQGYILPTKFGIDKRKLELSVYDVIQAIDPIRRITSCPLGLKGHGTNLCPLHRRLDKAMEAVETAFRDSTLADLAAASNSRK